ncbi:MAG: hypothetical protein R3B45_16410 [Bdellovibrionota bacterium]
MPIESSMGVIYGYSITTKGFNRIQTSLPYEVQTQSFLSDCPVHDLDLVDIRFVFESKIAVKNYYPENILQACCNVKGSDPFKPFIELNSDALVELNMNTEKLYLALEYEASLKNLDRYKDKIDSYYWAGVRAVLYICQNKKILRALQKIDQMISESHHKNPKLYFALYDKALTDKGELLLTNILGHQFRIE